MTRYILSRMRSTAVLAVVGLLVASLAAQAPTEYDFLIKGGRVIDPRNAIDGVRDVAIKDGRIAAVAANIAASRAIRPWTPAASS